MIRDHRPYYIKKIYRRFENFYVRRFIKPQLTGLGRGYTFMRPWHVEIFGAPIFIGQCVNVIATSDMNVRFSVWSNREGEGGIYIGNYCLICPGVRIGSALKVHIGDNCMLAHGVYVMDSDWHDIYNRTIPCTSPEAVYIEENAWIGDSAIICKGVRIGKNSIVGAGSVVVDDVAPNTIAAGNPARVIKELDPDMEMVTRADWFVNREKLFRDIDYLDKELLKNNSLLHWIRHLLFPFPGD